MNGKNDIHVLILIWGIVEEFKGKFKRLVHETWPWMYGWIVFKFYKKQMKSANHEICHDIVLSYVKTVVKNWEDFSKVDTYIAYKSKNLQRSSR